MAPLAPSDDWRVWATPNWSVPENGRHRGTDLRADRRGVYLGRLLPCAGDRNAHRDRERRGEDQRSQHE